jgi:hypothetical protein
LDPARLDHVEGWPNDIAAHPRWRGVGQNTPNFVKSSSQKYFTFPNFGFVAYTRHPGPARGALRDRHEMRAGVRWTR